MMKPADLREGATYRGETGKNRVLLSLNPDTWPLYGGPVVTYAYAGDDEGPEGGWHMSKDGFARWALEEVRDVE